MVDSLLYIRRLLLAAALATIAAEAETFPADQVAIIGSIDYGLKIGPVHYQSRPLRYCALVFNGKPGDNIEVWVHARRGAPIAFVTNSNLKLVAGGSAHFS